MNSFTGLERKRNTKNEVVTISVKGNLQKKIFSEDRFKGTIDIKSNVRSVIINKKEVEIYFIPDTGGSIILSDFSSYGNLFINNNFSHLTISVLEQD